MASTQRSDKAVINDCTRIPRENGDPALVHEALRQYSQTCTFSPTFDNYYASFHPQASLNAVEISGIDSDGRYLLFRTMLTQDSSGTSQHIAARPAIVIAGRLDREKTQRFRTSSLPKTLRSISRLLDSIVPREVVVVGDLEITSPLEMHLSRLGASVDLELINVLDLSEGPPAALLTKSVRQASAVHKREGLTFHVTDSSAEGSAISQAVKDFRELHAKVAGRTTRPIETWVEQEQLIRRGDAFMVSAIRGGRLLGGSFFFTTESAAYYASSASDRNHLDLKIGHGLVGCGIETVARMGINNFVVGSVNTSRQLTPKERGIQRFKSLFRGNLVQGRSYQLNKSGGSDDSERS